MFYQEALNYIKNMERGGSDYGIERMRELLVLLDEPDKKLKFVHVAGTNGKGSVCAFLTSILTNAGFKVGTYNSPSVFSYNERFLIDGKPFDDADVSKYMTIVKDCIEAEQNKRTKSGLSEFKPTAFEIETALAFIGFSDKQCDICVLETGLGGRWDATNAISDKELAIITPIGLDHCLLLGNTLGEIASEKAAIIKTDAVTVMQSEEIIERLKQPYELIKGKEVTRKSNLIIAHEPKLVFSDLDGQKFELDGEEYFIKLLGEHQLINAAIAITAAKTLRKKWKITDEAITEGVKKTAWGARFEIINCTNNRFNVQIPMDKVLILDGAHNPHGADSLANAIKKYFGGKKVGIVIGMLKDKDTDGVIRILAPLADEIIAVTPPSERAMNGRELKLKIESIQAKTTFNDDIKNAVNTLLLKCDAIVLCGSLTLFQELSAN